MLLGGIYRSASYGGAKNDYLLDLISADLSTKSRYLLIFGDFNYPEINWKTWCTSGSIHCDSFKFLECIRDNYLHQ